MRQRPLCAMAGSESEAQPQVAAHGEIVVYRAGPAGDPVVQLPVREMLIGPQRELEGPTLAELAAHAGKELDHDLGIRFRLDGELPVAGEWTARIRHVDRSEPEAGAQKPFRGTRRPAEGTLGPGADGRRLGEHVDRLHARALLESEDPRRL